MTIQWVIPDLERMPGNSSQESFARYRNFPIGSTRACYRVGMTYIIFFKQCRLILIQIFHEGYWEGSLPVTNVPKKPLYGNEQRCIEDRQVMCSDPMAIMRVRSRNRTMAVAS